MLAGIVIGWQSVMLSRVLMCSKYAVCLTLYTLAYPDISQEEAMKIDFMVAASPTHPWFLGQKLGPMGRHRGKREGQRSHTYLV